MFYKLSFFLLILFCLAISTPALAIDPGTGPYLGMEYGAATGLGKSDIRWTAARVVQIGLGLLGILATVLIVYAGFKWMTAAGNEEQAGEAKKIMYQAVIGLVIIMSAYSIVRFVLPSLFKATTTNNYSTVESNW